ncbi:MAG: hypothetical protein DMF78_02425 [Acidobacteria bacterium]|nr:MAG: hypothetical protein DMF78_02425 [Acidobacteriota bacterium]
MSLFLSLLMFLMMPRPDGQASPRESRGGAPALSGSVHAFDDPDPCDGTDPTVTCSRIHIPIG